MRNMGNTISPASPPKLSPRSSHIANEFRNSLGLSSINEKDIIIVNPGSPDYDNIFGNSLRSKYDTSEKTYTKTIIKDDFIYEIAIRNNITYLVKIPVKP